MRVVTGLPSCSQTETTFTHARIRIQARKKSYSCSCSCECTLKVQSQLHEHEYNKLFHVLLYLGYAQIYWVFNGTLNLLFLARFCKTLFLPEFLSNQLEILTQHSKSSQEGCYEWHSWMAKGHFYLLVKWVDTALCCSSNAKGSIHLLVNWADTVFWLARQLAYNRVQCWFNSVHVGWFSIHCQEVEQGAPMSIPTPPFSY